MIAPRVRSRKSFVDMEVGVTRYEIIFFYCMFKLIISIKLPNSLIPIKTFQLVPALEKDSCLKTQPEICKQE